MYICDLDPIMKFMVLYDRYPLETDGVSSSLYKYIEETS